MTFSETDLQTRLDSWEKCSGLMHWEDPEGSDGEGGGKGNTCKSMADLNPSHPQLSPSPSAFNFSQHQGLFQWVGSSHQVTKVLDFSFSIIYSMNIQGWFPLGNLKSPVYYIILFSSLLSSHFVIILSISLLFA